MSAGLLFQNYFSFIFIGIVIANSIAIIVFLVFYKYKTTLEKPTLEVTANQGNMLHSLLSSKQLFLFMIVSVLNYFIYIQCSYSLPMQVNTIFQNGTAIYGSLMTVNAICVIILTPLITFFMQNLSSLSAIGIGGIMYAVGFGSLYYAYSYPILILSTISWTIGEILVQTNISTYVAKHSPEQYKGRFNSLQLFLGSIGTTIGPLIIGSYISAVGIQLVWSLMFLLGIIFSALIYLLFLKERQN